MSSPAELLRQALGLVPTQGALADKLLMTPSRLSRVMKGARLSAENCIGLAGLLEEYPHVVLRAYGYEREAAILERAYPVAGVSPKARRLLANVLEAVTAALDEQARVERQAKPKGPRRRKR